MSDEAVQVPAVLDENLAEVDISMPIIKGGSVYDFEIKNVEVQDNKAQTGQNLVITLATMHEVPSKQGPPIEAGFPLYDYIGLTAMTGRPGKKDYTEDDIRRALARFMKAVHGEQRSVNPLTDHIGKAVKCKVSVTKPTEEYPHEGNRVAYVLP